MLVKKKFIATIICLVSLFGFYGTSSAEWQTFECTAYTYSGDVTATGESPYVGGVACNAVPLGTRIQIDGQWYTVNDRSGASGIIDIFMGSYDECINFGRQYKEVYIER